MLTIAGLGGFFYAAGFDAAAPSGRSTELLGVMAVSGWANVLHLALGLAGLAAALRPAPARAYALLAGLALIALGSWGLASDAAAIASRLPVDTAAGALYLTLGIAGLACAAASPRAGAGPDTRAPARKPKAPARGERKAPPARKPKAPAPSERKARREAGPGAPPPPGGAR